jgi:spore coat polysaccharide biosynthesis protein SpsF
MKPADDVVVIECGRLSVPVFRGSELDVLDRYYRTAKKSQAEVVVRVTADCPLIEPEIVDQVVMEFLINQPLDFATNRLLPRTFPRGQEIDVMSFGALERAWREDENPKWREHVTPYIYQHPEKFSIRAVTHSGVDYSSMRWTVDTSADLDFVRCVYEHFGHDRFSWYEVLTLLRQHHEWLEVNQQVVQKGLGE